MPKSYLGNVVFATLAVLVVSLIGMLGFHPVEHVTGIAAQADDCPVCGWSHDLSAGPIAVHAVQFALRALGDLPLSDPLDPIGACATPISPRAPPVA